MPERTPTPPGIVARRRAVEARELLLHGQVEGAQQVLDEADDDETLELAAERVRLAVSKEDLDAAEQILERWPTEPQPRARLTRMLWSAAVADLRGDERRAVELTAAVTREAMPEGHVGLFLDVGRPVLRPTRELYATEPSPFLRGVLEHPLFTAPAGGRSARELVAQLTEQELVVLGFLPSRLSNAAIAAQLGVSLNTIKTHLKHIYQKFNASGRSEAIEVAERLGLL
jgi:LuxR family maltose regulon positive regulatory protein